MLNDLKKKKAESLAFAVKVGHGYRQIHDVKCGCYRCLFSGRLNMVVKRACAQTPTQSQRQSCFLSSFVIKLYLILLMFTTSTVMGIGNFSKHLILFFVFFFVKHLIQLMNECMGDCLDLILILMK